MARLSRRLGEALDERTIVVNKYDLDLTQTCFRTPGSYFASSPAAGLARGPGAAERLRLVVVPEAEAEAGTYSSAMPFREISARASRYARARVPPLARTTFSATIPRPIVGCRTHREHHQRHQKLLGRRGRSRGQSCG